METFEELLDELIDQYQEKVSELKKFVEDASRNIVFLNKKIVILKHQLKNLPKNNKETR